MFAVGIDSHIILVFGSARNLYNTNTFCFAESPGCFQLLQTIQTHYGMAVTSFQLKDALLIAFASYQEGKFFYKTKLPVYVLQQNTFTLNQTLDSFGARDVEYFTINFQHFLVMATEYDGHSYKQDSVVYRWEAGKFKEFQRIPTKGVKDTHYFTIGTRKFISFTNQMYGSHEVSIYE